ncbi:transcriptional regulator PpsR [Hasllibacter halocynthiae]|uniref:Transcriptional regulator PpsR n=1 Tax=Hasllibacter halocynthiae TaxID=595589 RepID=A0A2T0X2W2_9RHOB|nr:transcriptional regulator PpsR [Hasllibacter halocynthiae]PRY93235.1 transcriptional regulator PpsR [Hasllibacter halocynthiae]
MRADLRRADPAAASEGLDAVKGGESWHQDGLPLLSPDRLGEVLASVADLILVIDEEGRVMGVTASSGLREAESWRGLDLRDALTRESVPKLEEALAALKAGKAPAPAEMNHPLRGGGQLCVRYGFHPLPEGGALLAGRDLGPIAELQSRLVEAQVAVEREYERLQSLDTRFRVLLSQVGDPILILAEGTGRIEDLNPAAATLIGTPREELQGAALSDVMGGVTASALSASEGMGVRASLSGERSVEVRATSFRAGGERLLLAVLSPEEAAPPRDRLTGSLRALWRAAPEGFVLTDARGIVVEASDGFLALIDASGAAEIRGRSLAGHLGRGQTDLKVLLDGAGRGGAVRGFATRLLAQTGRETPVEISATALDGEGPAFGFVLRDVARAERGGPAMGEDDAASVAGLVGNAPLREIVADTTDVVEKMCIETAVDLTGNNRVAAAEMLGLSRQSLYVKLRKYGLLNKGS